MLKRLIIRLQMMLEAAKKPNVKDCCEHEGRLNDLQRLNGGLERCQKSLTDYLDAKRNAFPRFFFISDEELLSILGSSDPSCVQEHMVKVGVTLYSESKCNISSLVK
jgi:dynein heavy chain